MTEYTLIGFSDVTVTDSGKVFVVKHLKHTDKRVELKAVDDVYDIRDDDGVRHRYVFSRILLAAQNGMDPRDEAIRQMQERRLQESLLPSTSEKVASADTNKALSIVASQLKDTLLSSLRKKGKEVDEGDSLRAEMAVDVLMDYYRLSAECAKSPMTSVEISREGNERLVVNPLIAVKQKQAELARKEFASLGISYEDFCKISAESESKSKSLFEEADFSEYQLV